MKSFSRPFIFVAQWVRKHWKLSLFLLVIIIGVGYFGYKRSNPPPEQLEFVSVKRGTLTKKLNVSGIIDAKQKASIHYAAGGKVVYISAKEGDIVRQGQTLARVDTRDLQKRLAQDLNLYFNQRMTFETNAADRSIMAPTDDLNRAAQQDQKTLENSVLAVEIRDIAIRDASLTTPIGGILVAAPTGVAGVVLNPTDIFEVVDPSSLVFKAAVAETEIALVKNGQIATIELDAFPDEPLTASVSSIAYRSSQSSSGTVFVVELPLPIESSQSAVQRYRLGMNGDTDITVDEKEDVLQIPLDALIERDDKTYVRKRTGENSAEEVEIQVGLETDDMVEVISGLQENDEVVLP
ncbi:efflux RND transporter periplasmic adaptor subunit [Patescibacteria group bacterium]|nr:efflux RND transporter periplasmic adaptor subunit [Patescibacteria group bacterium]